MEPAEVGVLSKFNGGFSRPEGLAGRAALAMMSRSNRGLSLFALECAGPLHGRQLLDLGFGHTVSPRRALELGANVIGVDPSPLVVRRAAEQLAGAVAAGKARFMIGSSAALPVDSGSCDVLVSVNTVYFWGERESDWREIARVLKGGATLVIGYRAVPAGANSRSVKPALSPERQQALLELASASGFSEGRLVPSGVQEACLVAIRE